MYTTLIKIIKFWQDNKKLAKEFLKMQNGTVQELNPSVIYYLEQMDKQEILYKREEECLLKGLLFEDYINYRKYIGICKIGGKEIIFEPICRDNLVDDYVNRPDCLLYLYTNEEINRDMLDKMIERGEIQTYPF